VTRPPFSAVVDLFLGLVCADVALSCSRFPASSAAVVAVAPLVSVALVAAVAIQVEVRAAHVAGAAPLVVAVSILAVEVTVRSVSLP
jgi:hypothetical protein